jgi:hypothetical protein
VVHVRDDGDVSNMLHIVNNRFNHNAYNTTASTGREG